jgi:hypothetical protein
MLQFNSDFALYVHLVVICIYCIIYTSHSSLYSIHVCMCLYIYMDILLGEVGNLNNQNVSNELISHHIPWMVRILTKVPPL